MNIFKWFKNRKKPVKVETAAKEADEADKNEIVYNKEIKQDNGTLFATINVLPTKEVQLYLQLDVDYGNGINVFSTSLYTGTVDNAMRMMNQICSSFKKNL